MLHKIIDKNIFEVNILERVSIYLNNFCFDLSSVALIKYTLDQTEH